MYIIALATLYKLQMSRLLLPYITELCNAGLHRIGLFISYRYII